MAINAKITPNTSPSTRLLLKVIPISEKEVEERLRRKKIALILSGIGGILYLIGAFLIPITMGSANILVYIIAGVISLIGTGIGVVRIKIGGVVILISIPLSIIIVILLNLEILPQIAGLIALLLYPLPFPHSVFVVIGGILCLLGSDK